MAEKITHESAKTAMVAAVSTALKYKNQNPSARDEEVIAYVVKMTDQIIQRMSS